MYMLQAGFAVRDGKSAPEWSHALKVLVPLGQPESCRGAQEEESILQHPPSVSPRARCRTRQLRRAKSLSPRTVTRFTSRKMSKQVSFYLAVIDGEIHTCVLL